jgi:hypothetical protein
MTKQCLMLVLVTACAAAQHANDGDNLDETIQVYNDAVRWERFDKAAVLLPPLQRADAIDQWDERAHDLKITEWEVVEQRPRVKDDVKVHVKLSWYRPSEEVVRVTDAMQTWHKKGKGWLLVEEARLRGPEMPGLPEPRAHRTRAAAASTTPVPNREETR